MILGGHWIPNHGWKEDEDWLVGLNNTWVLIVNYDVDHIHRLYSRNKTLSFILRDHALSEQHDFMKANPKGAAREHVDAFIRDLDKLYHQASERGYDLPSRDRFVFLGINEPHVWTHEAETVEYSEELLRLATAAGIRVGALNMSVGWPANTGRDTPVNWDPYRRLPELILEGNHFLSLHEYWPSDGVSYEWGWLAGRFTQCPFNVPIMITEAGVDECVKHHIDDFDKRGWQARLKPEQYAAQLHDYISRCNNDDRIVVVTPFTSDYGGPEWKTFNMREAYQAMREYDWSMHNTWQPIKHTVPAPPKPSPVLDLKIGAPVDEGFAITQEFGESIVSYAPFKGHMGIDYATPVGTPVYACDDGIVLENWTLPQEGKYIKLGHSWGESVYMHLSDPMVEPGVKVKRGQVIALSGNTGRSTGPHLHFGIRINPYDRSDGWNGYSDPKPYITPVEKDKKKEGWMEVIVPPDVSHVVVYYENNLEEVVVKKKTVK